MYNLLKIRFLMISERFGHSRWSLPRLTIFIVHFFIISRMSHSLQYCSSHLIRNAELLPLMGMCIPALVKIPQLRPTLIVPTGRISGDFSVIEPGNQRIGSRAFQRASGHPKRTSIDEVIVLQRW